MLKCTQQRKTSSKAKNGLFRKCVGSGFIFRTHRSYIVNTDQIDAIESFGGKLSWIYLKNGVKAKLSLAKKELFKSRIEMDI